MAKRRNVDKGSAVEYVDGGGVTRRIKKSWGNAMGTLVVAETQADRERMLLRSREAGDGKVAQCFCGRITPWYSICYFDDVPEAVCWCCQMNGRVGSDRPLRPLPPVKVSGVHEGTVDYISSAHIGQLECTHADVTIDETTYHAVKVHKFGKGEWWIMSEWRGSYPVRSLGAITSDVRLRTFNEKTTKAIEEAITGRKDEQDPGQGKLF